MRLLLLSLALLPLSAAEPEEARKRYDAGDFHAAASLLRERLAADPDNASLRYNLGNALFKAGKLGPAIAQYQRAFDLLPRDSDIRFNLEFALRRSGEELIAPGVPPPLFALFYALSERELAGLHWLTAWAALLLASAYLWKPPWRPRLGAACAWALSAWALMGLWWLARGNLEPAERGVIVAAAGEIRSGPGANFSVSFTAPEGRRVQVLAENGGWLEIGVPKEGAKGWILAESVEKIY